MTVDELAQEIRRVDGAHDLGAGALAEALMPFLRARTSEPEAGGASFLGHVVAPKSGVGAVFIPKGEAVPLMDGRGTVTPVYDGPQNVTHPSPATADKLRETTAKISSELEFIKIIASNLKGDIDRMEAGFTKSQKSRVTERAMLGVRQRSDTLIQCATDALATLSPKAAEGGE